jgi:DNA-binding beta-propeller fold protein YncE
MQFMFWDRYNHSGYLAFTPTTTNSTRPLLLVTDAGHDAVHVIDVVGRTHEGYMAPFGSIAGPRGVAASRALPLVAVSAWKEVGSDDHVVHLYRGSGAVWEAVRVIGGGFGGSGFLDGQLRRPHGLRFNRDGSGVCVADWGNNGVSLFRVGDGGFVRYIATGLSWPSDVEEVEGGWLVVCEGSHTVEFVGDVVGGDDGGRPFLGKPGTGDGEFNCPVALATVPGLGLVVREHFNGGRLQIFATPDTMAMYTNLSGIRIAWMSTCARAVFDRRANMMSGHWCRW